MPMLANERHERFAQELALGKSATEAYALAGYRESRSAASRLSTNVNVLKRVAELRGRAEQAASSKLEVTLQWLMEKAEEARQQAMDMGQNSAAVAAIKELGVLAGHRIEKRETMQKNAHDMTDDELIAIIRAGDENSVH